MLHTINGLPAHVLLIHAVVILVPLTCLMLVASAVWPAARRRLGIATPAAGVISVILVPVTVSAGRWFQSHLHNNFGQSPQVVKHAHLGGMLLPWAIGLAVMTVVIWGLDWQYGLTWRVADHSVEKSAEKRPLPVWVSAVLVALAIAVAVGTLIQLYRIGDSGAQAVWKGSVSS